MRILRGHLLRFVFIGWLALAGNAGAQITVNGAQTNQIIDGFGVNLNYQGWTNTDLEPVIDALVDQANATLFRVILDNSDWEGTNDNSDADVMNWDYYNTIYSSPKFQQFWSVLHYLNQKGITNGAIMNFQGPGPAWMGGTMLTPGFEDEWAETIASLLYYARYTENLQFSLVEPDNEPDYLWSGIDFQNDAQYVTMLHDLAEKLDTNGLSDVRFVAPDLAILDENLMTDMMADPVVMAKMAHFGLHSYSDDGSGSGIADFLAQSPYPDITFWMTEFNVWCQTCQDGQYATYDWSYCEGTAQYLLYHLVNGASGGMVWDAYDSEYYVTTTQAGMGWVFWGIFGVNDTNAVDKTYTARKNFYTLSQIYKYVLPGSYCIGLTGSSSTSFTPLLAFWYPPTGKLTLVGVNTDSNPDPLSVSLVSLPAINDVHTYYTDANSNLVQLPDVATSNNGTAFTATIPANCVFTLVGDSAVSVSVTNPGNGAQFTAPATIPILASVSNIIGSVSEVDFFSGTNALGSATNAPYGIVWSNVPPGRYALTATAVNSTGSVDVSPPVGITVVGPLTQISVAPSNAIVVPYGLQQFVAHGFDALGTAFSSPITCGWSAAGGTIDSNGLFLAGAGAGGPFIVTATNGSLTASANVTIQLDNLSLAGTGYVWHGMTNATANAPRAAAPGINDGNLSINVLLDPGGAEETSEVWEAAGVVWRSPQTISQVTYINGSYNSSDDGVFAASFTLQFSPDGSTWTNAGLGWTFAPAYSYNSPACADVAFTFTGGEITVEGVRCAGLVHTASGSQNSWVAFATEMQAFAPPLPVLLARPSTNGIVISWTASVTNFVLESASGQSQPWVWSVVTNAPQPVNSQQQVVIAPSSAMQFFRLQQQ